LNTFNCKRKFNWTSSGSEIENSEIFLPVESTCVFYDFFSFFYFWFFADSLTDEEGPLPTGPVDVSQHVAVLKRAAKTKKVPPTEVFAAIRAIEKAKVEPLGFLEYLGGTQSPGRTWMLVFSVSKEVVIYCIIPGQADRRLLVLLVST
jgi:hypothetical protein